MPIPTDATQAVGKLDDATVEEMRKKLRVAVAVSALNAAVEGDDSEESVAAAFERYVVG